MKIHWGILPIVFFVFVITHANIVEYLKKIEGGAISLFKYFYYPICHLNPEEYPLALAAWDSISPPFLPITGVNVQFLIFTRENPEIPIIFFGNEPLSKLEALKLDFSREIVLFCNGYILPASIGSFVFPNVLLPQKNYIIINVDYDEYAFSNVLYTGNVTVPRLGKIVGDFLTILIEAGADPKKITLIGFSSGTQAVGLAAKRIRPKIARIIAYSPSASCFNYMPDDEKVVQGDADYLVMVHCSSGIFEYPRSYKGNATFYVNGGLIQPACLLLPTVLIQNACSHLACMNILLTSLLNIDIFVGVKCPSYQNYTENECDCKDKAALVFNIPDSTKGLYFIETLLSSKKPCLMSHN